MKFKNFLNIVILNNNVITKSRKSQRINIILNDKKRETIKIKSLRFIYLKK